MDLQPALHHRCRAAGRIPIEEVLFFLVIPLCGLLTYNAVSAILGRLRRIRIRSVRRS
ncbi:hypothetical protein I553_2013 [Mycobacterium xenopi 4042]|uniref:Uncharacterized protein n=1 Tax=Mycobacterium xenopi 4042 TaxID=1299334 RepID=X8DN01_MYCXE|nr:hypothetical protein I553_2013 [Mycobacterium xenopi 4042]